MEADTTHVVYKLTFRNEAYDQPVSEASLDSHVHAGVHDHIMDHLQISSDVFFELFPFHMVFKRSMMIVSIGEGLQTAMKNVVHESVKDVFHLHRPLLPFTWDTVWIFT